MARGMFIVGVPLYTSSHDLLGFVDDIVTPYSVTNAVLVLNCLKSLYYNRDGRFQMILFVN